MEDSNKHIIEEIVRQVGYLPELYEDARSEKKIIIIKKGETKFCIISLDYFNRFNYNLICNSVTQVLQHVGYIHSNAR